LDKVRYNEELADYEQNVELAVRISDLDQANLQYYAENLQRYCKKLKLKVDDLTEYAEKYIELNVYGDVTDIIKEKEKV